MPSPTQDQIKSELRRFIVENYLFREDDGNLADDDSFLAKRIIDSTGILELISFLESRFALRIADEDVTPDNLDSIHRITAYVQRKLTDAPTPGEVSRAG